MLFRVCFFLFNGAEPPMWWLFFLKFLFLHICCLGSGCLIGGWFIVLFGDMSRDGGFDAYKKYNKKNKVVETANVTSELDPLSTLDVLPLLDSDLGARTVNWSGGEWFCGLRVLENVLSTQRLYLTTSSVTLTILPKIDCLPDSRFADIGDTAVVNTA